MKTTPTIWQLLYKEGEKEKKKKKPSISIWPIPVLLSYLELFQMQSSQEQIPPGPELFCDENLSVFPP